MIHLDNTQLFQIKNIKVRELLVELNNRDGFQITRHPKNDELLNVFSNRKMKNVLGDIRVKSVKGSFRLEDKNNGEWRSFKKFAFSIEDDAFVHDILEYID